MSDTTPIPPASERERFEADARPYGFDLTRDENTTGEPWCDYKDHDTGHRWGGWLAALEPHQLPVGAALSHPSTPQGWTSVAKTMPESGRTVLAYYLNQSGKERRVRAQWIAAKSHESSPDSDIGEYDEEADAYFDPEGWYECIDNWDDYSSVGICGVEVTHWMPLPPPPEQGGKG